jgi:hypothetical protein
MPRLRRRALALLVPLALAWPTLTEAQGTKAGVVTTLQGRVTAARAALQPVALKFKDDVFLNDRIVTDDRSIVRLLLGGKALVTVRERSTLTITEIPGRSTIELDSGKIAVAVDRDRMRPGETIEVKTPNAVAAVRGTVFVVEVTQAASVTSTFYGFTGQVQVTIANQVFTLSPDTFLSATGFQPPTSGTMTADVRAQALSGLQTGAQPVSAGQDVAKEQAVGSTVATVGDALPSVVADALPCVDGVIRFTAGFTTCDVRVNVPLLPGGLREFPVGRGGGGGGCGLPICVD